MEALTELTEAQAATTCTIPVSLFTLFLTLCDTGSMEALPELTKARAAAACSILGNSLVVSGGFGTGAGYLSLVEKLDLT